MLVNIRHVGIINRAMLDKHNEAKTLVIGLGNPIVSDDSVGLRVAERLKVVLGDRDDVHLTQDYWGGLRLMERMVGYDSAIIVDAICTGGAPGTIHHLALDSIPTQRSASAHDVNLPTALVFGRRAGLSLPADDDIRLVGIEAEDVINFGERCTPAVEAAISRAVEEVIQILESMRGKGA
ncbi:MAG: hydrogenase maturation protease [Planctomycetes bacterium]|nr:hydrogenase maturation protease [Planctomycetota bacterium]